MSMDNIYRFVYTVFIHKYNKNHGNTRLHCL